MTSYCVEYAKSGRSTCKETKEKIPQGEIRIAKCTEEERHGEPITMQQWYLAVPFFQMMKRMRKKDNQLKAASDLAGLDELGEEDQAKIRKMIEDFHDPDVDFPPAPPKKKSKKTADDEEGEPEKKKSRTAKKELPEIEDEVREVTDLKALAKELVERSRARGVAVPPDDKVATQKIGALILSCKNGTTIDIAGVLRAADKEFGAKKTMDTDCPDNADLALAFLELADLYFKQGDRMRGASYRKVATAIAEQPEKITSGKECAKLPGVGKASVLKIDEFLTTGGIEKLDELRNAV